MDPRAAWAALALLAAAGCEGVRGHLGRLSASGGASEVTRRRGQAHKKKCPDGYRQSEGDVIGWDQFGRGDTNILETKHECASDCDERPDCASFEWSRSTKICNLNRNTAPPRSTTGFQDFVLCEKREAAEVTPAAAKKHRKEPMELRDSKQSCPTGYGLYPGDVPGWDQFGREQGNLQDTVEDCGQDCAKRLDCLSFEWSPTTRICNLIKVAYPAVKEGFEDYRFCHRLMGPAVDPDGQSALCPGCFVAPPEEEKKSNATLATAARSALKEGAGARHAEADQHGLTLGAYKITFDGMPVNETPERSSRVVDKLGIGARVKVLKISGELRDGRVRALIEDPRGWISLYHPQSGATFAHEEPSV